jgi:hypothetical protein
MKTNIHFWNFAQFFLEFQTKVTQKIKTRILRSITSYSRQSYCSWDNVQRYLEQNRSQMRIWHIRIACWTKAKAIHSEYVIIIAFPLQRWLHEGTSMLLSYVHRQFLGPGRVNTMITPDRNCLMYIAWYVSAATLPSCSFTNYQQVARDPNTQYYENVGFPFTIFTLRETQKHRLSRTFDLNYKILMWKSCFFYAVTLIDLSTESSVNEGNTTAQHFQRYNTTSLHSLQQQQ